jgi:hypothetical protein
MLPAIFSLLLSLLIPCVTGALALPPAFKFNFGKILPTKAAVTKGAGMIN